MARVNLEKELTQKAEKRTSAMNTDAVLKEAQKLITDGGTEDVNMLIMLSPKSVLSANMKEKGRLLELEKHREWFSGLILTEEEIVSIGSKYRLKFLPSSLYNGNMASAVVPAIRELELQITTSMAEDQARKAGMSVEDYITVKGKDAHKHKFDEFELKNRFFILAPAEMFETVKEQRFRVELPQPDPILFYKIEDAKHDPHGVKLQGARYRMVKKWGNDFTIVRLVKGWLNAKEARFRLFCVAIPVVLVMFGISTQVVRLTHDNGWWALNIATLIAFAVSMIAGEYKADSFGEKYVTSNVTY